MATDDYPGEQEIPAEQVAWAGLPINLDFAFSHVQRDKVYVQHVTRKRWCSLRGARDSEDVAAYDPLDAEAG
jgi:sulfite reductase alpha subunit-like flavoprotein